MDELSGHFQKPRINPAWVNVRAVLPYGLTVDEILEALQAAYDFFHDVNSFLT